MEGGGRRGGGVDGTKSGGEGVKGWRSGVEGWDEWRCGGRGGEWSRVRGSAEFPPFCSLFVSFRKTRKHGDKKCSSTAII